MSALVRTAAALATATALAVVVPAAAHAAPSPYTPQREAGWSAQVCPDSSFTHRLPAGTFGASQQLLESVTGSARTAPVAASFLAAETSYLLTSAADGSAAVKLTFPAGAAGSYGITLAQQGDGRTAFGSVTVLEASDPRCDPSDPSAAAPVDPPAAVTDPAPASAQTAEQLPHTGTRISAGVVGGAAGAVVLGAVLSFVVGRRRRLRHR